MPPTAAASRTSSSRGRPSAAARKAARVRRRRLRTALGMFALQAVGLYVTGRHPLQRAVEEITLPLHHDDIIRQQSQEKGLDPALVAAVIYQESKFRDRTSVAGARGLMQITPDTARFI